MQSVGYPPPQGFLNQRSLVIPPPPGWPCPRATTTYIVAAPPQAWRPLGLVFAFTAGGCTLLVTQRMAEGEATPPRSSAGWQRFVAMCSLQIGTG